MSKHDLKAIIFIGGIVLATILTSEIVAKMYELYLRRLHYGF